MDPSSSNLTLLVVLLVHGAASVLLALMLGTLYAYRRQATLFFWAMAWLCNGIWLICGAFTFMNNPTELLLTSWGANNWIQHVGVLGGWWQAAFWLLSFEHFRKQARGEAPVKTTRLFPPWSLVLLLLVAGLALLLSHSLRMAERISLLACVLTVVASWGAIVATQLWQRNRRVPTLLLACALSIFALTRLYLAGYQLSISHLFVFSQPVAIIPALINCGFQGVLAAAMILFAIDLEQYEFSQTVDRLEQSEKRFRLIFEHSGAGMTLLTNEGRFLHVNPALEQMLGYRDEELRDKSLNEFVHSKDASREGSHQNDGNTPSFYEREKRYLRKDGQSIWARVLRVPISDSGGQTCQYVGVLIDVTSQRRAEDALKASEERYRLLNNVARDGIYVMDEAGTFLEVNPAFCQLLDYSPATLLKMTLAEVAGDIRTIRGHLQTILSQGGDRTEAKLRRRDGSLVDVQLSGALLVLEGKRLLHGICRDVTETKRASLRLQEERDFSRQVLETADVLIFVVDAAGCIVHFNGTCRVVLGYEEEAVRGKPFWQVLLPERYQGLARDGHRQLLQSPVAFCQAENREMLVHEMYWRTRAGEERLVTWRNAVVRDALGTVKFVISAGHDVTEQRRIDEQLRQAKKMESLGTLVGGIAHDFNNQLTAVLGNLSLALGDLSSVGEGVFPELHAVLSHAEEAAQCCAEITQRLLTFSSGRVGSTTRLDLGSLVAEIANNMRRDNPPLLQIQLSRASDIWPVNADAASIQQVIVNLIVNAREAMKESGVLTLTVANRLLQDHDCKDHVEARPGRFVELTVEDTGEGISAEVQSHLFEPFFTTKEPGRAAGMGLAIAYGIVKAHGGWITVQSKPGEGSTFRVWLPAAEVIKLQRSDHPTLPSGGNECILVVDDEELVRGLAEALLRRAGYRVLTAPDGENALEIYRVEHATIDLVLLDYSMPKMTGLEVMREMLKMDPKVRVIFSSGFARDSDCDQLLATGAKAFVPKPYRAEDMLNTVRRVLDKDRVKTRPGVALP